MSRALVTACLIAAASVHLVLAAACGGEIAEARPQVAVEGSGTRYPPLPPSAKVTIHRRGEPEASYREVGRVTASCPVKHWVRGHEQPGRPICFDGLRQGARMLGGQAVIDVEVERTRPPWAPDQPWLVMRGVVIRLVD